MRVRGHSMAPVLHEGALVIVDEGADAVRAPQRGEVVVARPRACAGRPVIKRLAGLPNERIEVEGRSWSLGANEFFLLGEQMNESTDSRHFGPVSRDELTGRVRRATPEGDYGQSAEVS